MSGKTDVCKKIIILSVSQDLSKLKASAENSGFLVFPAASPTECMSLIGSNKPDMVIHNLRSFETSQINLFHHRLVRHEVGSKTKRIILAPELTVAVLSLVADCALRKAIQLASALSNLGLRLIEICKEDENRSASQTLVYNLRLMVNEGNTIEFNRAVEEAFAAFPHDMIIKLEYGNLCFRRGEFEFARDTALRIVQLEPNNVRAMNLLARAEMKLGDRESALRILEAANKVCPQNPDRLTFIGDVLMQQGKPQEAKNKYLEALAVHPTAVQARENLSQCELSEEEIEYALKLFSEPLSEVERASFLNTAGIHALSQNRYEDALKLYRAALEHLKEEELRSSIYYNLALAHRKSEKPEKAIEAFQECIKLNPHHPYARAHLSEMTSDSAVRKLPED